MTWSPRQIPILMYHSLSHGSSPTRIAPEVFRNQMAILSDLGFGVVSIQDVAAWCRGEKALHDQCVALTFDDGFEDFATVAVPELAGRDWTATVFLPAGKIGNSADWSRQNGSTAPSLMTWPGVRRVLDSGLVELGAHGVSHRDLTRLAVAEAADEVVRSKQIIEDQTGVTCTVFAPPFGHCNVSVREVIRQHYVLSVGTRLGRASLKSDNHDLPRIEMHYFRDTTRWRAFLQGQGEVYFSTRRFLRQIRSICIPT